MIAPGVDAPRDDADTINLGNVIPFRRVRGGDAPSLAAFGAAERPAPDLLSAPQRSPWWAIVFAASLLAHAGIAALFLKSSDPRPAVGLEAISVEVVFGADAPAGVAATPGDEAQPQPPPEEPVAKQETVEPTPVVEVAPPIPPPDPEDLAQRKIKDAERKREEAPPPSRPASGVGQGQSRNDANYNGRVAAHLARYKRFPQGAQNKRSHGTAVVNFSLDGSGRVIAVKLVRSSGAAAFDEEAQAWVRRASPFPPPSGGTAEFTVPLTFQLK
jgi:protein TonB